MGPTLDSSAFDYTGDKIAINVENLVQLLPSQHTHTHTFPPPLLSGNLFSLHTKCVAPSEISVASQLAQVEVIFHSGGIFYT